VEQLYIEEIMKLTSGNKVHASKILGVDRKTLYRRMERKAREQEDGGNGEYFGEPVRKQIAAG
jgi:DNA-binding NtrC family response regulator